jgi:hypothetical protein
MGKNNFILKREAEILGKVKTDRLTCWQRRLD